MTTVTTNTQTHPQLISDQMINDIKNLVTSSGELNGSPEKITEMVNAIIADIEDAKTEKAEVKKFQCPGHTEFFHRYTGREKAKRKATDEVVEQEKKDNVKHAKYQLISKDSPEGKSSVYFKGLNAIYNHAIDIIVFHNDNCTDCEYHPDFSAKK